MFQGRMLRDRTLQDRRFDGWVVLSMATLALLFTGCVGEEEVDESKNGTPLTISVATMKRDVTASVQTRAATTLTSGSIGVYRLAATGYTGTRNNVEYTYSGGSWGVASGGTPIYLNGKAATICAYYPYNAFMSSDPTAIPLTSQLYSEAADLSYVVGKSLSSGTATTTFDMQRAYAKVTFTLVHEASYNGNCVINNVSIANAGVLTSNTLNMVTGVYGSGTAGTVSIDPGIASIASGGSTTATVLVVPSTAALSGNLTLLITIDGVKHTASLTASNLGASSKFEAGKNYGITVKIGGAGTTLQLAGAGGSGTITMLVEPIVDPANCYIVAPGASLTIPVNIKGNGDETLASLVDGSVSFTAGSVDILWQTSADLISSITFDATSQTATLTANSTPSTGGNAVIAAYSGAGQTGTILWSWHIWVTDYDPNNGTTYTITNTASASYTFMDRNLGAAGTAYSNDNNILHYQWGRKDPFPAAGVYDASGASASVDITTYTAAQALSVSVQHPFAFILSSADWNTSPNDALWGGASTSAPTDKTIFDPCPAGWRVAAWSSGYSPWSVFNTSNFTWSDVDKGRTYNSTFYPAAGCRYASSGALYNVGSYGYYWSASPNGSNGSNLSFYSYHVYPSSIHNRAYGFAVRCVQE